MPWKDSTEKQKHVCNICIYVYANKVKYRIKKYRYLIVLRFCFMSRSILLSLVSIVGSKKINRYNFQSSSLIFCFYASWFNFFFAILKIFSMQFALRASYKDSKFCVLNFFENTRLSRSPPLYINTEKRSLDTFQICFYLKIPLLLKCLYKFLFEVLSRYYDFCF